MPEILDIVNEHDEPIDQMDFADIRKNDHIFRVAHIWVMNDQRQLLLQLRNQYKDPYPRSFDASAAGKVAAGESYEETARRELFEEIGITDAELIKGDKYFIDIKGLRKFAQVFIARTNGPFKLQTEEVERLEWFTLPELEAAVERYPYFFVPKIMDSVNAIRRFV